MAETYLSARRLRQRCRRDRASGDLPAALITGLAHRLVWEFVVRALAPAYVAKPSTVLMAIPRVIVEPAFLTATGRRCPLWPKGWRSRWCSARRSAC